MYHWIRSLTDEPVSIYTFSPHGSKNITDLRLLSKEDSCAIAPEIVCHDQEPLCYQHYQSVDLPALISARPETPISQLETSSVDALSESYRHQNFYTMLRVIKPRSIFDRYILLHSEKNSRDVEQFSDSAETVYYWSHAIIARDWFRFAEHDVRLDKKIQHDFKFLVYCRAWTGTREYRLKFLDLLAQKDLIPQCNISVLHQDQDHHIDSYRCDNSELQPNNVDQLLNITNNSFPASASADYDTNDIASTDISIVLETVADNAKIHLTEKTLRPIACGHPFMLLAGPGSLEYLKSYGFKTFSPWINERYDQEPDIVRRIELVTNEMNRLRQLDPAQRDLVLTEIQHVAQYNKAHFFSKDFYTIVRNELTTNLNQAVEKVKQTKGHRYLELEKFFKHKKRKKPKNIQKRNTEIAKVLRKLRKNSSLRLQEVIDQFPPGFFNLT